VSALLPQSGGFEGAFWPGKALERENNATVNRPEVSVREHQVDVATPGTQVNVDEGHDPIFTVEEFLRLPDQPVECAAVFLGKAITSSRPRRVPASGVKPGFL
jgi:hypothetical protein